MTTPPNAGRANRTIWQIVRHPDPWFGDWNAVNVTGVVIQVSMFDNTTVVQFEDGDTTILWGYRAVPTARVEIRGRAEESDHEPDFHTLTSDATIRRLD